MTQDKKEAVTDNLDQSMREGRSWWEGLLETGKISLPNAIMLGIVFVALWTKMDHIERQGIWNVEMQDRYDRETEKLNPGWYSADAREVQKVIRDSNQ